MDNHRSKMISHFNVNQIGLFVDNVPISGNVMRLNCNATSYRTIIPAFNNMFEVTDKWLQDSGIQISRSEFAKFTVPAAMTICFTSGLVNGYLALTYFNISS
jgi:hypothetical protein